jgi:thiopurine S-methyltransferase
LQPDFWLERWRLGQIGFHQPTVDRLLEKHWQDLKVPRGRVLVPLCGKSLDLLWLRSQGYSVSGVELSAVALEAFCMENGIPAQRRKLAEFDVYESSQLQLLCGDFFALTPALISHVAAVYDRAALISWAPPLRAAYATHLASLLDRGTEMLLIALEYPPGEMNGPPFPITADDVEVLYSPNFSIKKLGRYDTLKDNERLRSRGVTSLHEACYALTRL